MFLFNNTVSSITFQKYANYMRMTLDSKEGMRLNGDTLEVDYYRLLRSVGLSIVTDEYYFNNSKSCIRGDVEVKVQEVTQEVQEVVQENQEVTQENQVVTQEIQEVIQENQVVTQEVQEVTQEVQEFVDRVYSGSDLEELTRDMCRDILDGRGVEHSNIRKVAELREKVLETNPIV